MAAPAGRPRRQLLQFPVAISRVFACNVFFACTSFAIVMPSLWPLLRTIGGNKTFLAWVVSAYSVGEAIGALAFGRAFEAAGSRALLLSSIAMAVAGSAMYVVAIALPNVAALWTILSARTIQGIASGGQQAIEQAFISERIAPACRTAITSALSSWATIGFLAGPILGIPLSLIVVKVGPFALDSYTSPAAFIFVAFAIMLTVTAAYFRPETMSPDALVRPGPLTDHRHDAADAPLLLGEHKGDDDDTRGQSVSRMGIISCNVIFAVHFAGFSLIETITTPLIEQQFGWDETVSFYLFAAAGVLSVAALVSLSYMSSYATDRALLLSSLLLAAAGYALMAADVGRTPFVAGFCLVNVAFPYGRALSLSVLSKLIGHVPNHADYMGRAFAIGAVARIVGPFVAVQALQLGGPRLLFGTATAMFMIGAALQGSTWDALRESLARDAAMPISPKVAGALRRMSFGRQASATTAF